MTSLGYPVKRGREMTTFNQRQKRILDALQAYHDKEGPKETLTLEWRSSEVTLPVIELPLDVVLLYSHSHRFRAQLEDHPQRDLVTTDDPWGDEAQRIVADVLRHAHRNFEGLKANLASEGQRDAGIVTRNGILINANSRAVALRELQKETGRRRYLKVAVLPTDADEPEFAELELRLQVQKELKDPYTLTNELLFIEDLTRRYNKTPEQIALDLRWASQDPKSRKRWAEEVEQRRRILDLIREMQKIPSSPIELTFFDDKLEQLKALEKTYTAKRKEDPEGAHRFRDNWICVARAGSSSVHDLRAVDEDFVDDRLRPMLEEDDTIGPYASQLFDPIPTTKLKRPAGLDLLDPDKAEQPSGTDVRRILDAFGSDSKLTIDAEGKRITFDADTVRNAIASATKASVQDFKAQGRARNRLDEPVALVREATARLRKANTKYAGVAKSLGTGQRGKLQYQVSQAKKAVTDLQNALDKQGTKADGRTTQIPGRRRG